MNSAVLVPGIRSCRTASVSFTWSAIFVRSFLRQKCGSRCYFVVPFSKGDCLEDEVVVKYLKARDSLGKERKVYSAFKKFEEEIPNIYTCLSRYDTTAIVNHLCRDSNSDHKSGIRDSNSDYKGGIRDSNSDYKSGIGDSRNPLSKPGSYSCKHEVIVRLLDSYLSSHVMPELKHLLTFHKYFCRTGDLDNAVKAQDAIFEHHKIQGNKIVELITDAAYAYGLNGEFRYVWGLISYKDIENTISFRKVMYAGLEGMCNSKNIRVGYVDRYYKWFYLPRFPQDSRAMHLYAKYMYNQQRYSECLGIFQLGKKTGCLNKNIYCVLIQAALQLKRTSDAKKLYSLCTKHQKRDLNVSPRSNIKTNLKEGSSAKEGFEKSDKNIKRSFKKNQAKCRDGINSNGTKCDDIKYSNGIKCDDTKSSDSTTDIKSLRNLIYTPNTPLVHMAFEDTENYLQENYEELLSDLIQKHNEFQERSQKMKLDATLVRYLTRDEYRVLVGIELGSRNHEVVPQELVSRIAKVAAGETYKILSSLAHKKLVSRVKNSRYMGFRLTVAGYDYLALYTFSKQGVINSVGSKVGVGKESDIYLLDTNKGEAVLKLHRLGRTSFRNIKEKRDYLGARTTSSWLYLSRLSAIKEYKYMCVLKENGFNVPVPLGQNRHCVVMSYVNAELLQHVSHLERPGELYSKLMKLIIRLASSGLIHGDFNEFNIMIDEHFDPVLIDFPQMISTNHQNAEFYFNRDVNCVEKFFLRRFNFQSVTPPPKFQDIAKNGLFLDIGTQASGFEKMPRKKLAEQMELLHRIHEELRDSDGRDESDESDESDEGDGFLGRFAAQKQPSDGKALFLGNIDDLREDDPVSQDSIPQDSEEESQNGKSAIKSDTAEDLSGRIARLGVNSGKDFKENLDQIRTKQRKTVAMNYRAPHKMKSNLVKDARKQAVTAQAKRYWMDDW